MSFEMERQRSIKSLTERENEVTKYFNPDNLPKPVAASSAAPLSGHTNSVSRVIALDDGKLLATACYDGRVRVYQSSGGASIPLHDLAGHSGLVLGLVSLKGSIIASGGWDDRVISWDARTGKKLNTLKIKDASINSIAVIDEENFVAGTGSGDLVFFHHSEGLDLKESARIKSAHGTWINHVCVYGDFIVTASFDKSAALWSIKEKKKLAILPHSSNVWCASISKRFVATGAQGEVRVYEIRNDCDLKLVLKGVHDNEFVHAVALAGDEWLLSAGGDGTVAFTSLVTETPVVRVSTAVPYVLDITLLPNGRVAVCGNESNDSYTNIFSTPGKVEEPLREYTATLFPGKVFKKAKNADENSVMGVNDEKIQSRSEGGIMKNKDDTDMKNNSGNKENSDAVKIEGKNESMPNKENENNSVPIANIEHEEEEESMSEEENLGHVQGMVRQFSKLETNLNLIQTLGHNKRSFQNKPEKNKNDAKPKDPLSPKLSAPSSPPKSVQSMIAQWSGNNADDGN